MKLELGDIEDADGYSYRRVRGVRYCFAATEVIPGWVTTEVWRHLEDGQIQLDDFELGLIYQAWQKRPELIGYFRVFPDDGRGIQPPATGEVKWTQ